MAEANPAQTDAAPIGSLLARHNEPYKVAMEKIAQFAPVKGSAEVPSASSKISHERALNRHEAHRRINELRRQEGLPPLP